MTGGFARRPIGVFRRIDVVAFEFAVSARLGPGDARHLVLDGKALRGSRDSGTPVRGRVVTADAMFTHRDVCAVIHQRGGNDILLAKDNQPNLLRDIQTAFAEPPAGLSLPADRASGRQLRPGP